MRPIDYKVGGNYDYLEVIIIKALKEAKNERTQ
jgi:hypothetical protein